MKWPIMRLEQLASPEKGAVKIGPFGSQLKKQDLSPAGIHVIGIENVLRNQFDGLGTRYISEWKFKQLESFEVRPGDVLITMMGTIGEVAVVPEGIGASIMDSHLLRFRPNRELCFPEYVKLVIRGSAETKAVMQGQAHGAIMKGLNSSIIRALPAPLPPLSEQRRIVEILDQADSLRRKRAAADAKASRILPVLFNKMFGDPSTNPMGWPIKPLGEITIGNPQYGANASGAEWSEGKPRYIRITDITTDGRLQKNRILTLDMDDWDPYLLTSGDLLFARSGNTVGKTFLYRKEDGFCVFAGYLIRFKPDLEQVVPLYLFAITQTDYYRRWVEARKRVAGQPNINGQEYANLEIPCPPLSIQLNFAKMIDIFMSDYDKRIAATQTIDLLFDSLLHKAFAGNLTSKWREAHMNELLVETEAQAKLLNSRVDL